MAVRIIDPVDAGLVIQGARQGQNFNIETPTVDGRPRKNRFAASARKALKPHWVSQMPRAANN